jgi:hypothetical protein
LVFFFCRPPAIATQFLGSQAIRSFTKPSAAYIRTRQNTQHRYVTRWWQRSGIDFVVKLPIIELLEFSIEGLGLLAPSPPVGLHNLGLVARAAKGLLHVTLGKADERDGMEGELVDVHDIRVLITRWDDAGSSERSGSQDGEDGKLHGPGDSNILSGVPQRTSCP